MQKNEVIEFLNKIDRYVSGNLAASLGGEKFELKIIGKSALLISGLKDSVGTVDIDMLGIDGHTEQDSPNDIVENLTLQFGRSRIAVNSYYLEFVPPALVFLPQLPRWTSLGSQFSSLSVQYLDSKFVIASKLFSAFSNPPRKKDRQDIIAALDQSLVNLQDVLKIADDIFEYHSMDARAERFPYIYDYITEELIPNYGPARIIYEPE